jgi:sorbitol/mannitol transport system permease protein
MATHIPAPQRADDGPSVLLLFAIWMIVPLAMTIWFSFQNYNLLNPGNESFVGFSTTKYFYSDPAFFQSISTRWCWWSACF